MKAPAASRRLTATRRVRVGLLGCGVVGGGVAAWLQQAQAQAPWHGSVIFELTRIAVRDVERERPACVDRALLTTDWRGVCLADDVDVVVEAMGGLSPAREAITAALQHGKHVVSANKQLLAAHGDDLLALAAASGRDLRFEASVLGAIPALHMLDTYFAANQIEALRGIMNGTSNYILTTMAKQGLPFAEALARAQAAGYAEADPTADIEGCDALAKLQILANKAFGVSLPVAGFDLAGISAVHASDLALAARAGWKLKHVAELRAADDGTLAARIGPAMVASDDPLFGIDGVQNGLVVTADLAGDLLFAGAGAGAMPTASAIVEDLLKLDYAAAGPAAGSETERVQLQGAAGGERRFAGPVRSIVVERAVLCVRDGAGESGHAATALDAFVGRLQGAPLGREAGAAAKRHGARVEHATRLWHSAHSAAWLLKGKLPLLACRRAAERLWAAEAVVYPVYGAAELPAEFAAAFAPGALPIGLS